MSLDEGQQHCSLDFLFYEFQVNSTGAARPDLLLSSPHVALMLIRIQLGAQCSAIICEHMYCEAESTDLTAVTSGEEVRTTDWAANVRGLEACFFPQLARGSVQDSQVFIVNSSTRRFPFAGMRVVGSALKKQNARRWETRVQY